MGKKQIILILLFLAGIVYYWMCIRKGPEYYNPEVLATHPNGEEFVGSETCKECHAAIYDTHLLTAHYNTSAIAHAETIKGSFEKGENRISLSDLDIDMIKKGDSFYQQTILKNTSKQMPPEKMDIVIGSGVKGKSYLTWKEEKLFQLQASYYPPADSWVNSPGFPNRRIERPIRDGCLKCHVTYAKNHDFSGRGNRYDRNQILYGVDCERCHRPASKHVTFHRNNPEVKVSKFMLKVDTLSRQLRMDVCAQCHSGQRPAILQGNSFSFIAGERLDKFSRNYHTGLSNKELDVHGNQYGLLTSSKCFLNSPQMDCSSCHDPHQKQRGNAVHFNQKCMNCHNSNTVECKADASERNGMGDNCITCHMPNIPSKTMTIQLTKDKLATPVYVRTHLIGIYSNTEQSIDSTANKGTATEALKTYIKENMVTQ